MKNIFIIGLFVIFQINNSNLIAQGCDPQVTQFIYADVDDCLEAETTILTVGWTMGGGSPTCQTPIGSWSLVISFPASGEYGITSASAVTSPSLFDWTYDASSTTLKGTNNAEISWLETGIVVVDILPLIVNDCALVSSNVNIQIIPSFAGGSPGSFDNNTGNDFNDDNLGVGDLILPVDLTYFRLFSVDCDAADLAWQTASEINNDGFVIERSIGGIKNFEEVGFVKGNSNSTKLTDYTFHDDISDVLAREVFYRLKQLDLDGAKSYSDLIVANLKDCNLVDVSVFPNPARNQTTIEIEGWNSGSIGDYSIIDCDGRKITSGKISRKESRIDLEDYQPGVYMIRVNVNNKGFDKRIILIK